MPLDQRLIDFQQLAALYAKQYAPYEWKRDVGRFDLLRLGPWIQRIERARDDIEFLEICAEYVGSLNDAHSVFIVPSNFAADSGLFADLYDGKALIDAIDRRLLPAAQFPFEVGDEIVSFDGRTPEEWMREFGKYLPYANARGTRRNALDAMVYRQQALYPAAHRIGAAARVQVRRQSGLVEAYDLPWVKSGIPLTVVGPVPSPTLRGDPVEPIAPEGVDGIPLPRRLQPFLQLRQARVQPPRMVRGIERPAPVFALPTGFVQRLGRNRGDLLYSGTFTSGGTRLGYLRVPSFFDSSNFLQTAQAFNQAAAEVAFFERNTDGLIVDVMRNPGGDPCLAQDLASLLIPYNFQAPGVEIRATRDWILRFESLIAQLEAFGVEKWIVDYYRALLGDVRGAYSENRGRTGPLPLCGLGLEVEPFRDSRGNLNVYTKPVVVMIDEFSSSAAETFAVMMQDSGRARLIGTRTTGAGGSVGGPLPVGWYSETLATVTQSLVVRPKEIATGDYPVTPYVENVGVRPDLELDIMTAENLRANFRPFFDAVAAAAREEIRRAQ